MNPLPPLGGWVAGRFPWLSQPVMPPPEKHLKLLEALRWVSRCASYWSR